MASSGDARHAEDILDGMALLQGSGRVLGGQVGPSAVAAVVEACARAVAAERATKARFHETHAQSSSSCHQCIFASRIW